MPKKLQQETPPETPPEPQNVIAPPKIRISVTKQHLPCKLTTTDLITRAKEMSRISSDKESLENQRKSANDDFKGRIAQIDGRLNQLSSQIASEVEWRDVPCEWHLYEDSAGDYDVTKKTLIRMDTADVVRTEETAEQERQDELPLPV